MGIVTLGTRPALAASQLEPEGEHDDHHDGCERSEGARRASVPAQRATRRSEAAQVEGRSEDRAEWGGVVMRRAEVAERRALADDVIGIEAACSRCGVASRTPSRWLVIVHDRVRGTGELVYGQCETCRNVSGDRDREALAALLRCDPDDRALEGVTVDDYSEMGSAHPNRPNRARWQHLDAERLAKEIDRNRTNLARLACPARQGCKYCGVSHTPPGTSWRREGNARKGDQLVCGSCVARSGTFNLRDVAGAVLVGFSLPYQVSVPRNIGAQLGVVFAYEAGVKKGSRTPWAHLDLAAIRSKNRWLVGQRAYAAPSWWLKRRDEGRLIGTVTW
jgi:hypothetical protein